VYEHVVARQLEVTDLDWRWLNALAANGPGRRSLCIIPRPAPNSDLSFACMRTRHNMPSNSHKGRDQPSTAPTKSGNVNQHPHKKYPKPDNKNKPNKYTNPALLENEIRCVQARIDTLDAGDAALHAEEHELEARLQAIRQQFKVTSTQRRALGRERDALKIKVYDALKQPPSYPEPCTVTDSGAIPEVCVSAIPKVMSSRLPF
jgi:hypothetical protein